MLRTVGGFGLLWASYLLANLCGLLELLWAAGESSPQGLSFGGLDNLRLLFNLIFPSLAMIKIMWKRSAFPHLPHRPFLLFLS